MSKFTNKDLATDFVLTIQFVDKGSNRMDMLVTTNDGTLDRANMKVHGMSLAREKLLSNKDQLALIDFCHSYLHEMSQKSRSNPNGN